MKAYKLVSDILPMLEEINWHFLKHTLGAWISSKKYCRFSYEHLFCFEMEGQSFLFIMCIFVVYYGFKMCFMCIIIIDFWYNWYDDSGWKMGDMGCVQD